MLKTLKNLLRKPPVKVRPPFYDIVCAHCFHRFEPEDVVFRAAHYSETDPDFALQEDQALDEYRAKFNLDSVGDVEAVISPRTIPEENKIYSDNVLVGITDRHGILTRRRLCPYCHNELPIPAGKVPSNIISIVGATSVGKSVYMTSLIHTLQHVTASNFHAACIPMNADISRRFRTYYEEPIFEQGMMLGATQKIEKMEPFIFNFVFKDETLPPLTLAFFDVAGEGMTDRNYLDIYAAHIKNSAGILFMVDPLQIKTIRDRLIVSLGEETGDLANRHAEPRDVIISMFENFIGHQEKSKTDIPTAIVLTKSDMLKHLREEDGDYIDTNSNVFRNVVHSEYLNLHEFTNIDGEIRRFIEKVDRPFKDAVDVYFNNTAYFAVSALGSNPVNKQLERVVTPIRVDEPFVWLLHKLEYIEGRDR
ncbi:TRAFAC clade GTPase domain-containing protein [Gorillibacterium massiliense]|uniref:TRAFAC clade GTPase domain-containing protein n=1 Tax=Gorillibacterium massiliense TaxID=1280390 RepID=UPI0004B08384|nr:hypothetical protein [Gorillibacterium massiliense]